MFLEADLLEEKVFLMQVFFERLIIPRFRLIARSSRGRCSRISATGSRRRRHPPRRRDGVRARAAAVGREEGAHALVDAANTMLPIFAKHVLWRPKAREVIGTLMEARDRERLREELNHGVRLANSLGSTSRTSVSPPAEESLWQP
jgi:hypothetical protein